MLLYSMYICGLTVVIKRICYVIYVLDKFLMHQAVKYDFTADLIATGNRSDEVTE